MRRRIAEPREPASHAGGTPSFAGAGGVRGYAEMPEVPPPAAGAAPPTTCIEAEPFALRVTDDSMEPEFAPGCIIIVDPTGVAKDGAFVLAEIEGQYIFRRLERTDEGDRLVALNHDYAPIALVAGLATVRGVVVQRAGARRRYHKRYD